MKTRHDERHERDATSSREVAQRYREAIHDADRDERDISLALLHYRGGDEEFCLGREYSLSRDASDRATGADILAQLGWSDQTFREESIGILTKLLEDSDECVIYCAAVGLGHRAAESAIPDLIKHADHSNALIREGVTFGLLGHEDERAIHALIRLAGDDERDVRNWAVFGLGSQIEADSPEIREALRLALGDPDPEIRGEALVGLANRADLSTVPALLEEWRGDFISMLSLEAAEVCQDPRLYPSLVEFAEIPDLGDDPFFARQLAAAIEACAPKAQ